MIISADFIFNYYKIIVTKIKSTSYFEKKNYNHPLVIKFHIILIKLNFKMSMMSVEVRNNFKKSKNYTGFAFAT